MRRTGSLLEFATELIIRVIPGRIGKWIAIGVWLIGTSLKLYILFYVVKNEWIPRLF
jgi:hypothetical protein